MKQRWEQDSNLVPADLDRVNEKHDEFGHLAIFTRMKEFQNLITIMTV